MGREAMPVVGEMTIVKGLKVVEGRTKADALDAAVAAVIKKSWIVLVRRFMVTKYQNILL